MTALLAHRCRNQHCRLKLPAPVENPHHAFCTRGCFERFYFNRCRVCEKGLRKQGRRGDANRRYCRPPNSCAAEAQRWPQKYEYGQGDVPHTNNVRNPHSTGIKFGIAGHRPSARCLREWWWGGDGVGDHSLYDCDGLTIARVVQDDDRYRLRTPMVRLSPGVRLRDTWHLEWPSLEKAKHGAESFALLMLLNRKRDVQISKRPVADWYERLDGTLDYYDETGRHVARQTVRSAA
jgi:hypothetical protein